MTAVECYEYRQTTLGLFYSLDLLLGFPLAIEYENQYSFKNLKFEYIPQNPRAKFEHPFKKFKGKMIR